MLKKNSFTPFLCNWFRAKDRVTILNAIFGSIWDKNRETLLDSYQGQMACPIIDNTTSLWPPSLSIILSYNFQAVFLLLLISITPNTTFSYCHLHTLCDLPNTILSFKFCSRPNPGIIPIEASNSPNNLTNYFVRHFHSIFSGFL